VSHRETLSGADFGRKSRTCACLLVKHVVFRPGPVQAAATAAAETRGHRNTGPRCQEGGKFVYWLPRWCRASLGGNALHLTRCPHQPLDTHPQPSLPCISCIGAPPAVEKCEKLHCAVSAGQGRGRQVRSLICPSSCADVMSTNTTA
jgi:hypothetical protein